MCEGIKKYLNTENTLAEKYSNNILFGKNAGRIFFGMFSVKKEIEMKNSLHDVLEAISTIIY